MISRPTKQTEANTHAAEALPAARPRYARYLLWALLLPLAAWLSAFPLVTSRSYEDWGETQYGPVLEFPYEPGVPDADVVIWGDSSAFLGIDPRVVNAQLGIHSVVLPSTVGSLPVIGDAPLRSYLAHHARPRLLVLYFSPWNLDFTHTAPGRLFEGEEMMMRHETLQENARFDLRHPLELLSFPVRLYSTFGSRMIMAALHRKSRAQDTAAALGHAPYAEPVGPLPDLCRIPASYLRMDSDRSVEDLRKRYQGAGLQVMVYLAPIPNCTNSGAVVSRSFAQLSAAPPLRLPPPYFAADPYYAHVLPPMVPENSRAFAAVLAQHLQQVAPELLSAKVHRADEPPAGTLRP